MPIPIMKLNSLLPFNGRIDLPPSYTAPPDKFHRKGKVIVLDRSSSMKDQEGEFKLVLSMIKALSGLESVPPVPNPHGRTNLIGMVKKIVESPDFGEQELVIVTDGEDNAYDINDFQVGVTDAGEPRMVTINQDDYPSKAEYSRARQQAILDYLACIGAQVHIIGIGNEVKELLKMAASRPMTVAHVPRSATATQVATIVGAAINIVRDTAVAVADFSTAAEHVAATDARIITVDNLCGQPMAEAAQVAAIESDAARVYVGDDAFDADGWKVAFAKAEDEASIAECAKKYTRGVVMWLMTLSLKQGKVPGATIGGKLAKVFEPPEGAGEWKVNKLLSELKKVGILSGKQESKVQFVVEGVSRTFTKVVCYEAAPRAAHLVQQMADDAEWATPEAELVQKGNMKRKREDGESSPSPSDDAQEAAPAPEEAAAEAAPEEEAPAEAAPAEAPQEEEAAAALTVEVEVGAGSEQA